MTRAVAHAPRPGHHECEVSPLLLVQIVISGLLLGGVYALVGVGISLIFGVMKIVNFAHGALLMLGMYLAFFLFTDAGIHPYLALPVVTAALFLCGVLIHGGFLRRVVHRGHNTQIVLTLGIGVILQSAALMAFGGDYLAVRTEPPFGTAAFDLGGLALSTTRVVAFLVASVATALVMLFLNRTVTGWAIRATAQDHRAAALMGIPTERMYLLTMGIGSGLAGTAASLLVTAFPVFPDAGFPFLLVAFVVVVLGGLGSVPGAYVGGLIVGVVEALAGYLVGQSLSQVVVFALFIATLIYRPQGIFGGEAT